MKLRILLIGLAVAALALWTHAAGQSPQPDTALTYQGRLDQNGAPAEGLFDFCFQLYDRAEFGAVQGDRLCPGNVQVSAGYFSVDLDFGMTADGQPRYLQIEARPVGAESYTLLTPRQWLSPAPFVLAAQTIHAPLSLSGPGDPVSQAIFSVTAGNGAHAIYAESTNLDAVHATSKSGYAGYFKGKSLFDGDVTITGKLIQPGLVVRLDDGQGRTVDLAGLVSMQGDVVSGGNTRLDAAGRSQVSLPGWFSTPGGACRYQLTPIGAPAPGLYIAAEAGDGGFEIAGGSAGLKVSWQVTCPRPERAP